MFKTEYEYVVDSIRSANKKQDENFVVAKNDYITIKVYTNNGERIIDPDFELMKGTVMNAQVVQNEIQYLVRNNGNAYFPMIGDIKVEGRSIRQLDSLLSKEYSKFYYNVYVNSKIINKRVVVIGAQGGKVIPLTNDNLRVIEAIALYGGISSDNRANNIRLIRGDLNKPDVSILNLSTIEGMKEASLTVEPNDIIYIEPVRRNLPQFSQDFFPIFSFITSIVSTVLLIANLNKR